MGQCVWVVANFISGAVAVTAFGADRVSVASNGSQATGSSAWPAISSDGSITAFDSSANNLVALDTNGLRDIFVRDRNTGQTTRVSVTSAGGQSAGDSIKPVLSSDGRFVAFVSFAANLVTGDANGWSDIFVHDRQTGQTSRVSVATDGSEGNGPSSNGSISADGRYAAFESDASNLIAGDTNSAGDIFVHDRQTGQTTRVSIASDGSQANAYSFLPAISGDGRHVSFVSAASNLVVGDTNFVVDVFVHDRQTGQTTRVSIASDGSQANSDSRHPSLSADGRFVAFDSNATNLVNSDSNGWGDVFVRDRQGGQTTRVSVSTTAAQGNDHSSKPSLSADGQYVSFLSFASNLVSGDSNAAADVFVHGRQTGRTVRLSVAVSGAQANSDSYELAISANGQAVAFESLASNLVSGDTNNATDIFVSLVCPADFDRNGVIEVPDIFAFLSAWFALLPSADFNGDNQLSVPDIFAFLSAWFAGCP